MEAPRKINFISYLEDEKLQSHRKALENINSIIVKEDPTTIKVIFDTSARGSSKQDTHHTDGQQRHEQARRPDRREHQATSAAIQPNTGYPTGQPSRKIYGSLATFFKIYRLSKSTAFKSVCKGVHFSFHWEAYPSQFSLLLNCASV